MVCASSLGACHGVSAPSCPPQQPEAQLVLSKDLSTVAPTPLVQASGVGCTQPFCYVFAMPVEMAAVPYGSTPMAMQLLPQVNSSFSSAQVPQKAFACELPYVMGGSQWYQSASWPADIIDQSQYEPQVQADVYAGAGRGLGSALLRRQRRQRAAQQQHLARHTTRHESEKAQAVAADTDLAAELTEQLEAGGEACCAALARLRQPDLMRRLSFNPACCRVVQLALELADRSSAAELAAGLQGAVAEAIESPRANYVIQKIITVLSPQEVPFVVEEIQAAGPQLACHEYGCRVFCRLLENAAADESTRRLIDSMLSETELLLTHTYGHHVVECVLEHGLACQRSRIVASVLQQGVMPVAQSRTGAYVLEKALLYSSPEDQQALASVLLAATPSEMASLTRSQLGCMVLRAMLRLPSPVAQQVCQHLGESVPRQQLQTTKHGRRLLAAAGGASTSGAMSVDAQDDDGEGA